MTTGELGGTALVYKAVGTLCHIFKDHPGLAVQSISVDHNGHVQVACMGTHGVLMQWSRAVPEHAHTTALVPTQYGLDEADVLEAGDLTITIRRPLVGPGGVTA